MDRIVNAEGKSDTTIELPMSKRLKTLHASQVDLCPSVTIYTLKKIKPGIHDQCQVYTLRNLH